MLEGGGKDKEIRVSRVNNGYWIMFSVRRSNWKRPKLVGLLQARRLACVNDANRSRDIGEAYRLEQVSSREDDSS